MIRVENSKIRAFGIEGDELAVVIKGDMKKTGETTPDTLYLFPAAEKFDEMNAAEHKFAYFREHIRGMGYTSKRIVH